MSLLTGATRLTEIINLDDLRDYLDEVSDIASAPLRIESVEGELIAETRGARKRPSSRGGGETSAKTRGRKRSGGVPLAVPIEHDGTIYGRIVVQDDEAAKWDTDAEGAETSPGGLAGRAARVLKRLIEERIEAECRLDEMASAILDNYRELNLLYSLGDVLALEKGFDVNSICDYVISKCMDLLGSERASIQFLDEKKHNLVLAAARGLPENVKTGSKTSLTESSARTAIEQKRALIIKDIDRHPEIKKGQGQYKSRSFISAPILCIPMKLQNGIVGIINLTEKKGDKSFSSGDLKLLSAVAFQTAISIQNTRLVEDLKDLIFNIVKSLISAIDAKDHYTRGHSERVTDLSVTIGRAMGLEEEIIETLQMAGLLHDIGKIGVPEAILLKDGKLTEHEWTYIKAHPDNGVRIIEHIKQMDDIIPLVRHHHERVDGRGYPDGCKGTEIPLGARIINVADSYDAMTSNRPYRKKLTEEVARGELLNNAGTQFDRDVVNIFLEIKARRISKKLVKRKNRNE